MLTDNQTPDAVTINGKEYQLSTMSDTAKSLLSVFNQWQNERDSSIEALNRAKIDLAKNEAALRDLSREIVELMETEEAA